MSVELSEGKSPCLSGLAHNVSYKDVPAGQYHHRLRRKRGICINISAHGLHRSYVPEAFQDACTQNNKLLLVEPALNWTACKALDCQTALTFFTACGPNVTGMKYQVAVSEAMLEDLQGDFSYDLAAKALKVHATAKGQAYRIKHSMCVCYNTDTDGGVHMGSSRS